MDTCCDESLFFVHAKLTLTWIPFSQNSISNCRFHGLPWKIRWNYMDKAYLSMEHHGSPWTNMEQHGQFGKCSMQYGNFSMDVHGKFRLNKNTYGTEWKIMS